MTLNRSITSLAAAAAIPLVAIALASCGDDRDSRGLSAPPKTASGAPATVGAATTELGEILVDSQGRTIYLFKEDTGTDSTCSGDCADDWPPVRASDKPTVGRGASASLVGTTARADGKPQVTYNGHPLYLYAGDENPGDTNGQGLTTFGALWWVLSPAGNQVTARSPSSGGGGSIYGGY